MAALTSVIKSFVSDKLHNPAMHTKSDTESDPSGRGEGSIYLEKGQKSVTLGDPLSFIIVAKWQTSCDKNGL